MNMDKSTKMEIKYKKYKKKYLSLKRKISASGLPKMKSRHRGGDKQRVQDNDMAKLILDDNNGDLKEVQIVSSTRVE